MGKSILNFEKLMFPNIKTEHWWDNGGHWPKTDQFLHWFKLVLINAESLYICLSIFLSNSLFIRVIGDY